MIKQFIIVAQILGLFFYQLLFTVDLTVTQKLPAIISQGKDAVVEITIDKGDLPGFAKIQQDFPDGFTAEPIETKGATFSFKDNKLKFIWMSLPVEKVFTISYKITPNETVIGDFSLGGKFSFISESERQNIEIPVSNFTVVKQVEEEEPIIVEVVEEEVVVPIVFEVTEGIADTETEIVEETIIPESSEIKGELGEEKIVAVAKKESAIKSPASILCKRTVTPLENGKYNVVVEISKAGVEGFCKITEKIPSGFLASEDNSNKGVFSFENNTMKILWMGAPKEDVYSVSYFLESNTGTENGSYDIIGLYSYLENDATSRYIIDGTSFKLEVEELVVEEAVIVTPPKEIIEEKPKEVLTADVVEEEIEIKKQVVTSDAVTSTPSPEGEVTYKVQVGAGHEKVPKTYFATVFKLQDKVSTINHEGWIKYLVGSYNEYKSARNKRNVVRSNVKTAFVTAYNSGSRITVQEALMISNQKWYK